MASPAACACSCSSEQPLPLRGLFKFGKSPKLQAARSGDVGGQDSCSMLFNCYSCRTNKTLWTGACSSSSRHPRSGRCGRFRLTALRGFPISSVKQGAVMVSPQRTQSLYNITSQTKKMTATLGLHSSGLFAGLGQDLSASSRGNCLLSSSKKCSHVSDLVPILL